MKNNKLHRTFGVLNVISAIALLGCMVWFMSEGGLSVKATASSCFVLMGGINLSYALYARAEKEAYPTVMFFGFVFAMLGDILLGYDFILGAGLFAVGHIFYAAAFCTQVKMSRLDALVSAVFFAGGCALLLLYDQFDFGGALMLGVCMTYALIISCMAGKAVSSCIKEHSARNILMAVGAVSFFFSDVMLVLRFFADAPWIVDRLCLASYFPAQGLLALSVYAHVRKFSVR